MVILIILATVSVNLVLNSGLIDRTTEGANLHRQEEGREAIILAISKLKTDCLFNNEDLTLDYIGDHIHEELGIDKENVTKNGEPAESIDVIYKGYEYEIDEDFNVTILGPKEGRIEITYRYEIEEKSKAVIYVTATTQDKKGIKRIINPDGDVQEYTNQEKSVTIEYAVEHNGKYTFVAEGNNGRSRKRNVKVEGLDYFNVSFDNTKDFLSIEQAHDTSIGTKTEEQNNIISAVGNLVTDNTILYATKIEDNSWTVIGNSKEEMLDGYYLYDKCNIKTTTYYTEGTWTSWAVCKLELTGGSRPYKSYTFNSRTGKFYTGDEYRIGIDWGTATKPITFYGPVVVSSSNKPGLLIGSKLTQYRNYGAYVGAKQEKRTKTSVKQQKKEKGGFIGEIIEEESKGLPTNGEKTIDGVSNWYVRKTQAKPYYLYKYIEDEIQTTYDVQTSQIRTKKIEFDRVTDRVKILVNADNTDYKLSISNNNTDWTEIEDKTLLNGEKDINLPETWSHIYIKIEKNDSVIHQIVVN